MNTEETILTSVIRFVNPFGFRFIGKLTFLLLIATMLGCSGSDVNRHERAVYMNETEIEKKGLASIVLGGGCFWCVEAVFQRLDGVVEVVSGYAGGHVPDPTYEQVVTGRTGHAEVVRVVYDPQKVELAALLDLFWRAHDPTSLNRQGADVGTQYRSAVFHSTEAEAEIVRESLQKLGKSGLYSNPVVTEVAALTTFYPAELYHQNYFNDNPNAGYCRYVIAPKLRKLGKIETAD